MIWVYLAIGAVIATVVIRHNEAEYFHEKAGHIAAALISGLLLWPLVLVIWLCVWFFDVEDKDDRHAD
jgi:hypothetical protein